jgi:ComF family protein
MNAILRSLIQFLYPAQCRHCEENLDPADGHYICKICWKEVKFIEEPFCQTCGHPLSSLASLPVTFRHATEEQKKVFSCDECPDDVKFRKARAIAYYKSAVGTAITLLKDQDKTIMANPLADLMFNTMPRLLDVQDYDYIMPVPIHKKKMRKRGYNQMELIGRRLSTKTGMPLELQSLVKSVNTPPQRGLDAEDRQKNIKDSFEVSDRSKIEGKRILLIDDVMTTGATINECAKVLLKDGKVRYTDVLVLTRPIYSSDFSDIL